MRKIIIALSLFISSAVSFAQGDDCAGATSLGTLPTPSGCPSGTGTMVTYNGTTVGSTAENPFSALSCADVPAADVWLTFVASGNEMILDLSSGLDDANISIYQGADCNSLTGMFCFASNNGNISQTVQPFTPGETYYMQISGKNETDFSAFTLELTNYTNCNLCAQDGMITATPAPVNGTYLPGQTVQFCVSVQDYVQVSTNWMHGMIPSFGSGWNPATLTPVSATGEAGSYNWIWTTVAGEGTGYFADYDPPGPITGDGDPTNNYGMNSTGPFEWCFQIATDASCTAGAPLNISINTTADGETGSWTSIACQADADIPFSAVMACCTEPLVASIPTTCQGDTDGSATAQGQGGVSPYDYVWKNDAGTTVFTDNDNAGVSSLSGMPAGTYTVYVTDNIGCLQIYDIVIADGPLCACLITNMSANIGACEATNTFTVDGTFDYIDNPGTGTCIVAVTNASGTYTQVFNPPFVDGNVYNYSISGIPSDGSALTVTVYFSDDVFCTQTINSTSPADCGCAAQIGTFTTTTNGVQSGNNVTLCFGNTLSITANGDYTPPAEALSPPSPDGYDPGISWLVYTCPPTMALVPSTTEAITDDPCLLTIASNIDLNEVNDMWWINNYPPGTFTNNTVYFVPITMYNMAAGVYSYVNTTMPCYELGTPVAVQFLPQIIQTTTQDCVAGTATTTVSGGQPAVDGSNFTANNLLPATASFGNTTASNGGTITVTGLVDGDNYSFDITDANGCPITITGTFIGTEDPSFTYPASAYCQSAANPSPTITGVAGGAFSAPPGMVINTTTGVINLAGSATGTYTVTYTTPDPVCFGTATFDVTINPLPIVDGNDETICAGASVTLNGTGADTYTWTGGVTDGVPFTPAATTTYTVTGTITATGCQNTGTATVTVNPLDDATFTLTNYCVGSANSATVTGTPGGTFAFNPAPGDGATINAVSGSISNGVGGTTYTVEYTTSGTCPASSTQTVTVNPLPVIVVNDVSVCTGGTVALSASGATSFSWSPATYLSNTSGSTVDCTPAANISYTITGTDINGCVNNDGASVTIIPNAPINAGADVTICAGESTTLVATGGVTYNWAAPINASGDTQIVSPASTTTYTVDGQDANGCLGTDQVTITVNPLPTATITGTAEVCEGGSSPVITFTGANGTSPYTFTYNINGGASQIVTSVGAIATVSASTASSGTFVYNLESVADASATNCSQAQSGSATITVNSLPTATIAGTTDICVGGATPSITFTGANGTEPYTFTYTINGGAPQTIVSTGAIATIAVSTAAAGSFSYDLVSVSDASTTACSQAQTGNATVVVNPLPTAAITGTTELCVGAADATITFTGANGTTPYTFTYTLNGGAPQTVVSVGATATVMQSATAAGTFTYDLISVQDASSTTCSQAQAGTATVTVNPSPTATISGTTDLCVGAPSATITFTGADGTAPYTFTYDINGGAPQTVTSVGTTATVTVSTAVSGTFNYNLLSVQDASVTGCSQAQPGTATVTVNPLPTGTISGTTSVCENDVQPSITFTGANGTVPYTFTYNINGGAPQTVVSVGTTATVSVPTTPTGTYNYNLVSVQDASSTACSQAQAGTATVTVNPNPVPVINGATDYCTGTSATLSTTLAYVTYNWSTGDNTATTNVTTADNPITVTVTNAFGCSGVSAPFTVTENSVITYNSTVTICQGESAIIHGNPETVAGIYSQTFVLGTGCDSTSNVTLVVNPLPAVDAGIDQMVCNGTAVTLSGIGATTYTWDNGVTNGVPFTPSVGSLTYTVTGTDGNGCQNTDQVDVTVNPLPTATISGTTAVCVNSLAPDITFTGANGTAPYTFTYNINGGAAQTVTSVGATATATVSAPTTTAGTFTYNLLSVQDASSTSCSQAQSGSATVTVNPLPTATVAGNTAVCVNEASPFVTFTGASGTAPYTFTYDINGGAPQTVTSVSNTATVSVSTAAANTFIYNLLSVQDASSTSCVQTQSGSVTVVVNPLPTATVSGTTAVCVNAAAPIVTFTGANGTSPYTFTYNINGGASQIVTSVGAIATVSAPTSSAGTFTYNLLSVQDASSTSCSQVQSGSATVTVNPLPSAMVTGNTAVCVNASSPAITFTGANGTAPYTFTYNINGGASQSVVSTGNVATVSVPTTTAGNFVYNLLSVQDASSTACTQNQSGSATVTVNPLPNATVVGTTAVCVNTLAPTVTFTGSNGTSPYTFTYNVNGGASQTAVSVGNIATVTVSTMTAGTFMYNLISVQDAGSTACSQNQTGLATVIVNPLPTASISGTAQVCVNGTSPVITFTGSNGTAPYTFSYNINGGATQTIVSTGNTATVNVSTATAGTFTYNLLSVQDASSTGCSQAQSGTETVTVNALPNVLAGNDYTVCEGAQAVLTASGASSFAWTNGVINGESFLPTSTATYNVTGTDANGCQNSDDVIVSIDPIPVPQFVADTTLGCSPLVVTLTNLTVDDDLTNCIWTISNGDVLQGCGQVSTIFNYGGSYDVTLTTTNENGCIGSTTINDYIYVEDAPDAEIVASPNLMTTLNTEVEFFNHTTGADSYSWNFGDGSAFTDEFEPTHVYPVDEPSTYVVTMIASTTLGCTDTAVTVIKITEELIYYVPNTFTPDGDDYNEVFLPVFTSGFDPFDYTLYIFNRWGEIVFESHDSSIGWDGSYGVDGSLVQDGVYTWKIEFKTTANDERREIIGHVNLIR